MPEKLIVEGFKKYVISNRVDACEDNLVWLILVLMIKSIWMAIIAVMKHNCITVTQFSLIFHATALSPTTYCECPFLFRLQAGQSGF